MSVPFNTPSHASNDATGLPDECSRPSGISIFKVHSEAFMAFQVANFIPTERCVRYTITAALMSTGFSDWSAIAGRQLLGYAGATC
jgi:hypothetical protein